MDAADKRKRKLCIETGCEAEVTTGSLRCSPHRQKAIAKDRKSMDGAGMTTPKWVADFNERIANR